MTVAPLSPNRHKRLWAAVSAVVFLVTCWLSWYSAPPPSPIRSAVLSSSDPGGTKEVTAHGWIQSNHVRTDGQVHFWINLANQSDHEVESPQLLYFLAPGFEPRGRCWTPPPRPRLVCFEGAAGMPARLKRSASITLYGDLRPTGETGRYNLSAVFGWQELAGNRARKSLLLGPVEVVSPLTDGLFPVLQRVYAFGKDFGLPAALAVLTFLLGVHEQRRRDDQENAETLRARQQKEVDERRAQVQQTWTQLLEKHLKDAQTYYLPICSKLNLLKLAAPDLSDSRECFFRLMELMHKQKQIAEGIGGVHLKSRLAEEIFVAAYSMLRGAAQHWLGKVERARALDLMKQDESMAQFERRLQEPAGGHQLPPGSTTRDAAPSDEMLFPYLESRFRDWQRDEAAPFANYLPLVEIMLQVLEFEANVPFRYWYGKPLDFPYTALDTARTSLRPLKLPELERDLEKYLAERERELAMET
jgi:hypothetical protein